MSNSKITLYFLGTDAFARTILKRLFEDYRFEVLGAVVPLDAKVGREQALLPCEVKQFAVAHGIPVLYDPKEFLGREVDFLVVASYGHILSSEVLKVPKYESLNVHASLLPEYRGASPIQAALLRGDRVTGISIQKMVPKLDAGPVYAFSEVAIRPDHTAESLREELSHFGAEFMAQTLPAIVEGVLDAQPQDESAATYSGKIDRSSGEIDWEKDSAEEVHRKWRAYFPWPGIYTSFQGKRLKLLRGRPMSGYAGAPGEVIQEGNTIAVATRQGHFALEEVQLEGKSPALIQDFVRGRRDFVGAVLGQ